MFFKKILKEEFVMSGQNQNLTEKLEEVSSRIPQMLVSTKEVGDKIDGVVDETVAINLIEIDNEKKGRLSNTSPTHCRCGNLIPEERREALPGVKICVVCARNAQQTSH